MGEKKPDAEPQEEHRTQEPTSKDAQSGRIAANLILQRETGLPAGGPARELARALTGRVQGEVRFAGGDRALYAADASNYRQVPIGVVIPSTLDDVVETVRLAREHGAAIVPRGGGTSLAGQTVNAGIVIDFSKYLDRVLEIDPERALARVQPGVVLDALRGAAEPHGLTFGPDTSTHAYNTMGGMIGNNSCGVRSVLSSFRGPGSRTSDHVESLDLLLYDGTRMRVGRTSEEDLERIIREGGRKGEIFRALRDLRDRYADVIRERYPQLPRRVSGYNLDDLLPENGFHVARALTGSEGTCAVTLEAELLLDPNPPVRRLVILGFENIFEAGDHVPEVRQHRPTGIEAIDRRLIDNMRKKGLETGDIEILPDGDAWLFVEFGGETSEQAQARARTLASDARGWPGRPSARVIDSEEDAERAWDVRESGLGATAFIPGEPDYWEGWEDSAVPPDRVGEYYRDMRRLYDKYGYDGAFYGHIGEGVLHTRTSFDLYTQAGIDSFKRFTAEAAELVARKYGGSLSGEHGDGQARGELLPVMYGDELMEAFREFKRIWDPDWKMNPGKLIEADPRDANLRLGTSYDPPEPDTHFRYPEDRGSFARATLRCIGVGKCRRRTGGTMCPSFQVLREEKHTTRGRAHLLFEMLEGEAVADGWRNEEVRESLDLCLSCKGCKGECPVGVDIATYKAEFMSHHYRGRIRPRAAYAFGLIEWWSRAAALAPDVVNLLTATPGAARLARWVAGVDQRRKIPRFAPRTFRAWWGARPQRRATGQRVVLWPDAFNDHFHPEVLRAGVEVLEAAGCEVVVPSRWAPSGRPLYEFGMLRLATWQLRRVLETLRDELRAGTPIVVLEPSVASVFRDEAVGLFPDDEDARRLADRTFTLGAFLMDELTDYAPPALEGRGLLHGHCHHKSVLDLDPDVRVLAEAGLSLEIPDTGCCGMAGAFGFEAGEKCDVSLARAEQSLLPAVREAGGSLVITDGFSCREQIVQCTDAQPMHTAEALRLGLRGRTVPPARTSALVGAAKIAGAAALAGLATRGIRHALAR